MNHDDTETRGANTIRAIRHSPRLGTLVAAAEADHGHPTSAVGPRPNKGDPFEDIAFC